MGSRISVAFLLDSHRLIGDRGSFQAGSATFHNGLALHGAGANMTPRRRRAMTCAYMPDGAVFNGGQNVLPKSYFDSLALGDRLDNGAPAALRAPDRPLSHAFQHPQCRVPAEKPAVVAAIG